MHQGFDFLNRQRYYRVWEVCSQVTHHRWSGGYAGEALMLAKCRSKYIKIKLFYRLCRIAFAAQKYKGHNDSWCVRRRRLWNHTKQHAPQVTTAMNSCSHSQPATVAFLLYQEDPIFSIFFTAFVAVARCRTCRDTIGT